MKKILALLVLVCLFAGCGQATDEGNKLQICATLFPQYDFLRQIAGDKAEITLLLPPGMESHNFEPGVKDIEKIANSDMFVYTGASMEPWAETILSNIENDVKSVDVSVNIYMCAHEHTSEEYDEHRHEHGENDPHIWTSPKNALIIAKTILDELIKADPENSEYYRKNAETYFAQLESLDEEFSVLGKAAEGLTLCHGGKFAMGYLERDYGFNFLAAYDSCSSFSEPSAFRMKQIIDTVKEQKLSGVFCEELSQGRVADTISKETGVPVLKLHTCHNLTKAEFRSGETYVSLMKKNAENIRKVIGNA